MLITLSVRTDYLIPVIETWCDLFVLSVYSSSFPYECRVIEVRSTQTDCTSCNSEYVNGYSLTHHILYKGWFSG